MGKVGDGSGSRVAMACSLGAEGDPFRSGYVEPLNPSKDTTARTPMTTFVT
jgi:hypothetical protein